MSDFESACKSYQTRIERALAERLPEDTKTTKDSSAQANADSPELCAQRLREAMRYVCLNGGKRFRAMLVYACGEVAGATLEQLDAPAVAVEIIHAYSLVHDDLPAMDDDDMRRGRETCHIAYDEATAILVGDALQALAFEILCSDSALNISAEQKLRMITTLANAVGTDGMAGGQALDVASVGNPLSLAQLTNIHRLKTGELIRAAVRLGCLAAPQVDEKLVTHFDEYAVNIGLAFQIVDDILDAEESSDTLGKPSGADQRMQKATYASVLGVKKATDEARRLCENAIQSAISWGDNTQFLQQLAHFVVARNF